MFLAMLLATSLEYGATNASRFVATCAYPEKAAKELGVPTCLSTISPRPRALPPRNPKKH